MSTLTTFIRPNFGSPSHKNQKRKRNGIRIGKEEEKLSPFPGAIILYIENPKDTTRKLLELINEFGTVAEYKTNIRKLVTSLYINNELSEGEIKETIPSTFISEYST